MKQRTYKRISRDMIKASRDLSSHSYTEQLYSQYDLECLPEESVSDLEGHLRWAEEHAAMAERLVAEIRKVLA